MNCIRRAASYNEQTQVAPAAILWTESERQWQTAMPLIKQYLPELVELGEYDPENAEQRIGPAVWVKCAISGFTVLKGNNTKFIQQYDPGTL